MSEQPNYFNSKLRNVFWPIHKSELGKFIPMSALIFCILFNQNVLRILKDSILISEISAEVAAFAKVYCVTPAAVIFVVVYAKLLNILSFEKIFLYLNIFFMGFFILFAYYIYPNVHHFHMDPQDLERSMLAYPHFKWYIALFGNWSYIVFYSLSELWPNIFYVLLFWQFANEITSTAEAKRFYTFFSLFGNSSLIFVGFLMMNLASERTFIKNIFEITDSKITLVKVSIFFVSISTILSCLIVSYISKKVLTQTRYYSKANAVPTEKAKLGLVESFKYIAKSKFLWLLLICSAAFGLSINLVEAVWKAKIKELYPSVTSFAEFNSMYILWTGVAIMVMTIIGNNIMRTYSWFVAAVISPLIIMVTGVLFFMLVVFDKEIISLLDGMIIMSPLALAVSIGAIQNILAKGTKYSIWDTSREMLYIPLDNELKTKGKAAVDVISSKVGKSSSGLIQSVIFTIFPTATFTSISPILMVIFTVVCILWIYAVKKINTEYQKMI